MTTSSMRYDPVAVARQFAYVREAQSEGQNHGLRVNGIQTWAGGHDGDSYCCEFVWFVLDICFQGAPPFDRVQACHAVYDLAKQRDWLVDDPQPGDLVLSIDPATDHAHHIAICTNAAPLTAIAGNTSPDGTSSNGDGVHEHEISSTGKVFVRYPREAVA